MLNNKFSYGQFLLLVYRVKDTASSLCGIRVGIVKVESKGIWKEEILIYFERLLQVYI
jgi:hypothetical protein